MTKNTELATISKNGNPAPAMEVTPELIDQRLKNKAKVRITAYQATALMSGFSDILDEIDNLIIAATIDNLSEITYKLQSKNSNYCNAILQSLKTRGFTYKYSEYSEYRLLMISWPTPDA